MTVGELFYINDNIIDIIDVDIKNSNGEKKSTFFRGDEIQKFLKIFQQYSVIKFSISKFPLDKISSNISLTITKD